MRLSAMLEGALAHRSIGQERLGLADQSRSASSLDDLAALIDWNTIFALIGVIHSNAKGDAAWPPLAMFKALLGPVSNFVREVI